ncbi:four-helix bundle copper-binding protein [Halobacteriales archaeon QS_5_70_17]|nr:MAG: four-helix bundle copper-binding protein [Halobacteriales archaeon QS_5_70_17]
MALTDTISEIDHLSDDQRDCIENCLEAAEVCEWCADACADHGEGMAECIRLCRDVADVASLHARLMARDSEYSGHLAETCAELCEACAEECEQHDHDHCQLCAEVLPECAESCRSMA